MRADSDDDDLDFELAFSEQPTFSVESKLKSEKFQHCFVEDMQGKGFTVLNSTFKTIFV